MSLIVKYILNNVREKLVRTILVLLSIAVSSALFFATIDSKKACAIKAYCTCGYLWVMHHYSTYIKHKPALHDSYYRMHDSYYCGNTDACSFCYRLYRKTICKKL